MVMDFTRARISTDLTKEKSNEKKPNDLELVNDESPPQNDGNMMNSRRYKSSDPRIIIHYAKKEQELLEKK
jgi:hypothetical protein